MWVNQITFLRRVRKPDASISWSRIQRIFFVSDSQSNSCIPTADIISRTKYITAEYCHQREGDDDELSAAQIDRTSHFATILQKMMANVMLIVKNIWRNGFFDVKKEPESWGREEKIHAQFIAFTTTTWRQLRDWTNTSKLL